MKSLLSPYKVGNMEIANRVVMAPMTRCRAGQNGVPTEIMVDYYRQRSSAGLIISEGVSISQNADGYTRVPGIYTAEQQAAWRKITAVVHQKGGKIFAQLMHVGRVAHPYNKAPNAETVAPTAIKAQGTIYTDKAGLQEMVTPRELETDEVWGVIEEFKQAAKAALACGFDGVELHAGTGYLPMQFLSSGSNQRTDQYGGSVHNRIRFVIEALVAMSAVAGSEKVAIRIWPGSTLNDIHDANPIETYTMLLKVLNYLNLAYVHVVNSHEFDIDSFSMVKEHYMGPIMLNGGFTFKIADQTVAAGDADMISFGVDYIANPDLVERFASGTILNEADPATFYTPGEKGYIDYPMS